ncbi:MAG: hypothetical protein EOO00_06480, partial [Chitinophagaceae bacterium]
MSTPESYNTIGQASTAEFKDRGSKFIAHAYPISAVDEFKRYIDEVKKLHPKASHHCFAYRIGADKNIFRVSDDGEPSGTAGKPILGQIDSKGLTNTLVVVSRYFGGSLLGVPGLINAYKMAASMALQVTPVVRKDIEMEYRLHFDYTRINEVMRVIKQRGSRVVSQEMQLFPSNWFTGFKNTKLQLIVHQQGIANKMPMYKLSPAGMKLADGVTLKMINRVDNPNYVFLDLVIDKNAKPGVRTFTFGPVQIKYELKAKHTDNGKTRVLGVKSEDFIYLLMPDRFSNGDLSNDIIKGYRDETIDRSNKFSRHGGDFKGVENHLDYLNQLGVTAIWMTPVIENNTSLMREWGNSVAGYHGYWFTDHYQVDKRFGGNDGYLALSNAAHKKGIKLVQDAVYN